MKLPSLERLLSKGEGPTLELKRSTGELREAMEALCGMLNAQGSGQVIFGVSDSAGIVGQDVAESTLREIANASRRLEPAADMKTSIVRLRGGRAAIVVTASAHEPGPFTFEGRGYLRVGNTTQRMSHSEFDRREEIAGSFVVRFRPATEARGLAVPTGLGARAERVMSILRRSGPLGAPAILRELAERITLRSLQTELARLRKAGYVRASGRGRATVYEIREERRP